MGAPRETGKCAPRRELRRPENSRYNERRTGASSRASGAAAAIARRRLALSAPADGERWRRARDLSRSVRTRVRIREHRCNEPKRGGPSRATLRASSLVLHGTLGTPMQRFGTLRRGRTSEREPARRVARPSRCERNRSTQRRHSEARRPARGGRGAARPRPGRCSGPRDAEGRAGARLLAQRRREGGPRPNRRREEMANETRAGGEEIDERRTGISRATAPSAPGGRLKAPHAALADLAPISPRLRRAGGSARGQNQPLAARRARAALLALRSSRLDAVRLCRRPRLHCLGFEAARCPADIASRLFTARRSEQTSRRPKKKNAPPPPIAGFAHRSEANGRKWG